MLENVRTNSSLLSKNHISVNVMRCCTFYMYVYHEVIPPKDADRIAHRAFRSGSALFAKTL